MKGNILSIITSVLIPILIIYIAFSISWLMGCIVFLIVLAWTLWRLRADIYCLVAQKTFETNHSDAFKWFEKALKTKRMRPYNVLFYAYMLLREGVLDRSEELIRKTTYMYREKISPDVKLSAELNLALIKWKRGNLPGAILDLEEMYRDGYKSSVLYGTLGYMYLIHGDIDKAYKFNREAVEYNDNDNIIADNWGNVLLLKGDIDEAYSVYEELMDKNPTFMEAYYNFGLVLDAKGEKEKAIEMMEKTLTMEEKYLSELTHEKVSETIENIKSK